MFVPVPVSGNAPANECIPTLAKWQLEEHFLVNLMSMGLHSKKIEFPIAYPSCFPKLACYLSAYFQRVGL